MRYNERVRCGNLTACERDDPESLAGLCGSRCSHTEGLPSQGPAPLSTWGFSLASRFVLCLVRIWPRFIREHAGTPSDSGAALENAKQAEHKPIPDPQGGLAVGCFDGGERKARARSRATRSRQLTPSVTFKASLGPKFVAAPKKANALTGKPARGLLSGISGTGQQGDVGLAHHTGALEIEAGP